MSLSISTSRMPWSVVWNVFRELGIGLLFAAGFISLWWIAHLTGLVPSVPSPDAIIGPMVHGAKIALEFVRYSLNENFLGVILLCLSLAAYERKAERTPLPAEAFPHLFQGILVTTGMMIGALTMGSMSGANGVAAMVSHFYLKIALWIAGLEYVLLREVSRPKLEEKSV